MQNMVYLLRRAKQGRLTDAQAENVKTILGRKGSLAEILTAAEVREDEFLEAVYAWLMVYEREIAAGR